MADDPGFEQLPDGTIYIGDAAARASLKRAEKEAFDNAQKVVQDINEHTSAEKPANPPEN
jgi:hypothetical protein